MGKDLKVVEMDPKRTKNFTVMMVSAFADVVDRNSNGGLQLGNVGFDQTQALTNAVP